MAEKEGESVCNYIFRARDVDNITGEFGDVGEMVVCLAERNRKGRG